MITQVTLGIMTRGRVQGGRIAFNGFIRRLINEGRKLNVVAFAYRPQDINWSWRSVKGWLPTRDGGWVSRQFDLPDAVYNRYVGPPTANICDRLKREGVRLINNSWVNKWQAYQLLSSISPLRPHLPETELLHDWQQVIHFLERHPRVYLKPIAGSLGKGIVRVIREAEGQYRCEYTQGNLTLSEVHGAEGLVEWLKQRVRLGRFIIQQGLNLQIYEGQSTDIRVLMQKDLSGRWRITAMGARVGAAGRYTANLSTGGKGMPVPELVAYLWPDNPEIQEAIIEKVRALAFAVIRTLEGALGALGEIGLDLGLEADGRLWYIEHNSQPGRAITRHLGDAEAAAAAYRRPLEYARYLSELP